MNTDGHCSHNWYLLYCKAREEIRAVEHLHNQGIESFYPTKAIKRIRKGVKNVKREALFPNYLFVSLNPEISNFNAVRSTRGVAGFVKFGGAYSVVPNCVVENMKSVFERDHRVVEDSLCPKEGDTVVINDGVYQGLDAIYKSSDGLERSVLLIKLIEQQAELTIDNKSFKLK